MNKSLFLTVLEAGKFKVKLLASAEGLLSTSSLDGRKKGAEVVLL